MTIFESVLSLPFLPFFFFFTSLFIYIKFLKGWCSIEVLTPPRLIARGATHSTLTIIQPRIFFIRIFLLSFVTPLLPRYYCNNREKLMICLTRSFYRPVQRLHIDCLQRRLVKIYVAVKFYIYVAKITVNLCFLFFLGLSHSSSPFLFVPAFTRCVWWLIFVFDQI